MVVPLYTGHDLLCDLLFVTTLRCFLNSQRALIGLQWFRAGAAADSSYRLGVCDYPPMCDRRTDFLCSVFIAPGLKRAHPAGPAPRAD